MMTCINVLKFASIILCVLVHGITCREIVRRSWSAKSEQQLEEDDARDMTHLLARFRRQSRPMPNCGSAIRTSSGIVSSPRFPWKYETNLYCLWKITVPIKQAIYVEFVFFDITSGKFNICDENGDYLLIQDGDRDGQMLLFSCGSNIPTPITSTSNVIWITFHSDGDGTGAGSGFQLSFLAIDPPNASFLTTTNIRESQLSPQVVTSIATTTRDHMVTDETASIAVTSYIDDISESAVVKDQSEVVTTMAFTDSRDATSRIEMKKTDSKHELLASSISVTTAVPLFASTEKRYQYPGINVGDLQLDLGAVREVLENGASDLGSISEGPLSLTERPLSRESTIAPTASLFNIKLKDISTTLVPVTKQTSTTVVPEVLTAQTSTTYLPSDNSTLAGVLDEIEISSQTSPERLTSVSTKPISDSKLPLSLDNTETNLSTSGMVTDNQKGLNTFTNSQSSRSSSVDSLSTSDHVAAIESPYVHTTAAEKAIETETISVENAEEILPYPYDSPNSDGLHEVCVSLDSPVLANLDTFITMGELASDFAKVLPPDWQLRDINPSDTSDMVAAKTFIINFVVSVNVLLETIETYQNVTFGLLVDPDFEACLNNYTAQLQHSLSMFDFLEIPESSGIGPLQAEYDFDIDPGQSELGGPFTSDFDFNDGLFGSHKVHWCSSLLPSSSGVITSPNYPLPYPLNTRCEWNIPIQPFKSVALKFTDFNVGEEQNCTTSLDTVVIKMISVGRSEVTDRYCGSIAPPIIVSPMFSDMVTIKFISHEDVSYRGFQVAYTVMNPTEALSPRKINFPSLDGEQVDRAEDTFQGIDMLTSYSEDDQCSFIYTAPSGTIPSTEYHDVYEPGAECVWNINVAANKLINLNISSFTQPSNTVRCEEPYAYVEIFDFVKDQVVNEYIYCGQEGHFSVISTSNKLTFIFHNSYNYDSTFEAHYVSVDPSLFHEGGRIHLSDNQENVITTAPQAESECRDVFIEPSGNFSSPGYPNFYETNMICTWTILADTLEHIGLKFVDFYIDNPMPNGKCDTRYSYVRISYFDAKEQIASDQFCGSEVPLNITISHSHQMVIYFFSEQGMGKGFLAEYDAFNPRIDSVPSFPTSNKWMSLPDEKGTEDTYSWSTYQARGWDTAYGEFSETCGDVLSYSESVISSPGYPRGYDIHSWCSWIIIAAPNQYIELNFEDFNVGTSSEDGTCYSSSAFVEVSYSDLSGQVVSKYLCGNEKPATVASHSSQMKVYFTSHRRGQKGFLAEVIFLYTDGFQSDYDYAHKDYITPPNDEAIDSDTSDDMSFFFTSLINPVIDESIESNNPVSSEMETGFCSKISINCCHELGQYSYGTFYSPGYPNGYEENVDCIWIIKVPKDRSVSLVFTDFELDSIVENYEECSSSKTHVRVVYYDKQGMTEKLFCGHALPETVVTESNILYIEFISFGARNAYDRGFKALYRTQTKDVSDITETSSLVTDLTRRSDTITIRDGLFRGLFPLIPIAEGGSKTTLATESSTQGESVTSQSPSREIQTKITPSVKSGANILTQPRQNTDSFESDIMDMEEITTPSEKRIFQETTTLVTRQVTPNPSLDVSLSQPSENVSASIPRMKSDAAIVYASSEIKRPDMEWSASISSEDYEDHNEGTNPDDGHEIETIGTPDAEPEPIVTERPKLLNSSETKSPDAESEPLITERPKLLNSSETNTLDAEPEPLVTERPKRLNSSETKTVSHVVEMNATTTISQRTLTGDNLNTSSKTTIANMTTLSSVVEQSYQTSSGKVINNPQDSTSNPDRTGQPNLTINIGERFLTFKRPPPDSPKRENNITTSVAVLPTAENASTSGEVQSTITLPDKPTTYIGNTTQQTYANWTTSQTDESQLESFNATNSSMSGARKFTSKDNESNTASGISLLETTTETSQAESQTLVGVDSRTNTEPTPEGIAPLMSDTQTRLVMFICIGIGLVLILILVTMLIYCIMAKRHNTDSMDLVKERTSYWQSYQAFAGPDWPGGGKPDNMSIDRVLQETPEGSLLEDKPVRGSTPVIGQASHTFPTGERLI